jgi:hypothetical protein
MFSRSSSIEPNQSGSGVSITSGSGSGTGSGVSLAGQHIGRSYHYHAVSDFLGLPASWTAQSDDIREGV